MNTLTDVPGLLVGHAHDLEALTGVTVVLCADGAVAGVDVRGGAPGTRETDLLRPEAVVDRVHAIILCGGSAFGLAAATGVMTYLSQRGIGFPTAARPIPIVPAAVIYDLGIGRADIVPDAAMGKRACLNAGRDVAEGCVGAGAGATVGKVLGMATAMKSGVGTASEHLRDGLIVGALVVCNALGDIIDHTTGRIIAGARQPVREPGMAHATIDDPAAGPYPGALYLLRTRRATPPVATNTTIAVVATNAALDKAGCTRLAIMAQAGLAQAIRPAHTPFDGDTVFALATGQVAASAPADQLLLGAVAADVLARAIGRAAREATAAGDLPAARDFIT